MLVFVLLSQAQDRKQLEKKRKETEKEIALTKKILEQTGKEKKDNLHALSTIKNLIRARERLISTLTQQLNQVTLELQETELALEKLKQTLILEKNNFAKLVVNTYKTRNTFNEVGFIFSATNFFNALTRLKYLQLINKEQDRFIATIERNKLDIQEKIEALLKLKEEKELLLTERLSERNELEIDRSQKNNLLTVLTGKEQELKDKLKKQQQAFDDLNRQIKLAIEREMEEARKRREAEAKKKGESKESVSTMTPEAQALSDDFQGNKRKLPWPVDRGFVSQKFGTFAHPTLHGIYIENNGVDIATEQGAKARTVFRGEVSAVFQVPGMGKAVLINHGAFYTVYARLAEVYVVQGQKVQLKELVGLILTDENAKTELHFEVWKNQDKMDPLQWLMAR